MPRCLATGLAVELGERPGVDVPEQSRQQLLVGVEELPPVVHLKMNLQ